MLASIVNQLTDSVVPFALCATAALALAWLAWLTRPVPSSYTVRASRVAWTPFREAYLRDIQGGGR